MNPKYSNIDFTPGNAAPPSNLDFNPAMSPDQAKSALGAANQGLLNTLKQIPYIGQPLAGAVGGALHTGGEIDKMMMQGASHIPGPIGQAAGNKAQEIEKNLQSPSLHPDTMAGKIGQGAEQIGEFMSPGGLEKAAVGMVPKVAGFAGKALETATKAGVTAGSMTAVDAAQTGGDLHSMRQTAEVGGVAGGLSGLAEAFGPGLLQSLAKSGFRMTPTQEAKTVRITDAASKFIADNKITGTNPQKFRKLLSVNSDFEGMLQMSLPKGVAVTKDAIVKNIQENIARLPTEDPGEAASAATKAKEAFATLEKVPGDTLDVATTLKGKRSWGQQAFKMSEGSKRDPTVSGVGSYAVELGYEKALEDTLNTTGGTIKISPKYQSMFGGKTDVTLPEFNKVYSDAINAKNLTGVAQFRNDAGYVGKMFGLYIGKTIGESFLPGIGGALIGGGLGEMVASRGAGVARFAAEKLLNAPNLPTQTAKAIEGSSPSQGQ